MSSAAQTEENSEEDQNLPYLPPDIQKQILEKISTGKERHKLSLICKEWKQLFDEIQSEEHLPWIICFNLDERNSSNTCYLFNPSTQTTYNIKPPENPHDRNLFVGAYLHDIARGWLLFFQGKYNQNLFFLYSPFTNQIIKFPKLISGLIKPTIKLARISLKSTDPDYIIVNTDNQFVKTCHVSEESWNSDYTLEDTSGLVDLVSCNDVFYCLFSSGKSGGFDVKSRVWTWFSYANEECIHPRIWISLRKEIVMLAVSRDWNSWSLWKLDLVKKKWVVVDEESLKKEVMFIGYESRTSLTSVPATGKANGYGGHMFTCNYYRVLHWPVGGRSSTMASSDYSLVDGMVRKYWIQPPLPRFVHEF